MMRFTATIAELDSAAANLLAAYWEQKRGWRRMPAKSSTLRIAIEDLDLNLLERDRVPPSSAKVKD